MDAESRKRLELVVRCMDLTSLEQADTPETIEALCERAATPGPDVPRVAAVCVYPRLVPTAKGSLSGTGILVAAAAGAFPSGRASIEERVSEIRGALEAGADEIDTVLDYRALLAGDESAVRGELEASRHACGDHTMKVILETGALGTEEAVHRASSITVESGADFIKTSTGKIAVGAAPDAVRWIAETIGAGARGGGRPVGLKVAGGIRTADQALVYLDLVEDRLGSDWATPGRFRIGASSLLEEVVAALAAK